MNLISHLWHSARAMDLMRMRRTEYGREEIRPSIAWRGARWRSHPWGAGAPARPANGRTRPACESDESDIAFASGEDTEHYNSRGPVTLHTSSCLSYVLARYPSTLLSAFMDPFVGAARCCDSLFTSYVISHLRIVYHVSEPTMDLYHECSCLLRGVLSLMISSLYGMGAVTTLVFNMLCSCRNALMSLLWSMV